MRLDTAGNWRSSLRASKKDDKKINAYLLMYHVILTDCTITTRDFDRKGQNLQSWIASFQSRLTALQNPNSRKMFHTASFNIAYLVPTKSSLYHQHQVPLCSTKDWDQFLPFADGTKEKTKQRVKVKGRPERLKSPCFFLNKISSRYTHFLAMLLSILKSGGLKAAKPFFLKDTIPEQLSQGKRNRSQ